MKTSVILAVLIFAYNDIIAFDICYENKIFTNSKTKITDTIRIPKFINNKPTNTLKSVFTDTLINISFYDHQIFDHDSISLFLNDKCLKSPFEVTSEIENIVVKLVPGKIYYLIIYSCNQGDITPNTSTIIIKNSNGELVSKLKSVIEMNNSIILKPGRNTTFDTVNGRMVKEMVKFYSKSPEISINLWDHGIYDHDTISLFHNELCVVRNFELKCNKQQVVIKLIPNVANQIILFALNTGIYAPNTAAFQVMDGFENSKFLSLTSDETFCGSISVFYSNRNNYVDEIKSQNNLFEELKDLINRYRFQFKRRT